MDFYAWLKAQWDRVGAAVLAVAGVVALILGYEGVSRSTLPSQQIPYLASGGLLAVLFLGGAATLWLSADLRDEWRKLDDIHRELRAQRVERSEAAGPDGTSGPGLVGGVPTRPVAVVGGPAPAPVDPFEPEVAGVAEAEPVAYAGAAADAATDGSPVATGRPEPAAGRKRSRSDLVAPAPRRAPGTRTTRRPSTSK